MLTNNIYKNKYLKYKNKYLKLKNQFGGVLTKNIYIHTDIPFYETLEQMQTLNDKVHRVIPMNAYDIVDNASQEVLTTTGVQDCVVAILYNPTRGRYLAHYLRLNEFFQEFSDACQLSRPDPNCDEIRKHPFVCEDGITKIKNTLPDWFNEDDTIVHLFSQQTPAYVISRFHQFTSIEFNGTINLYFANPFAKFLNHPEKITEIFGFGTDAIEYYRMLKTTHASDTRLIDSLFTNNTQKKDFLDKWDNNEVIIDHIVTGINPDGSIFITMFDNFDLLEDKRLFNFYTSRDIKSITAPLAATNPRCVQKYSVICPS